MVKLAILINDALDNTHQSFNLLIQAFEDANEGLRRAPNSGERQGRGRGSDGLIIKRNNHDPKTKDKNFLAGISTAIRAPNLSPHVGSQTRRYRPCKRPKRSDNGLYKRKLSDGSTTSRGNLKSQH
ncbi:hypothetical protein ACFE04_023481 [Oxalis oulophora]